MEATYESLAQRIQRKWTEAQAGGRARVIVVLAGPPGSGKTTVAREVVKHVTGLASPPSIVSVSADGFHLTQATLRAMPNAAEAIARRGAPWTFDAQGVVKLVQALHDSAGKAAVTAPTFDHAVKDPVADGLTVGPEVQVCIVEGNYLLSDEAPWDKIATVADDRWLVRVDAAAAVQRVAVRHLRAGIEPTMEKARQRAEANDMVNGYYVMEHSQGRYDVLIESVEDHVID